MQISPPSGGYSVACGVNGTQPRIIIQSIDSLLCGIERERRRRRRRTRLSSFVVSFSAASVFFIATEMLKENPRNRSSGDNKDSIQLQQCSCEETKTKWNAEESDPQSDTDFIIIIISSAHLSVPN